MSNILLLFVIGFSCAVAYPASSQDGTVIVDISPVDYVRPARSADPGHHHHHHHHGRRQYDDGFNNGYGQGGFGQGGYGQGGFGQGGYGNYGGYNQQPNFGGYDQFNNGNSYSQASAESAVIDTPFGDFSISAANANSGSYSDY